MERVRIGDTEMEASRIGVGTWAMGGAPWGGSDEPVSVRVLQAAREAGINLIDTSPAYGSGRAEEIVGRAVREQGGRYDVLIATKAGLDGDPDGIRREVEGSLRRLRTDHLDILQLVRPDPGAAIEDAAAVLAALYAEGKIRAIGLATGSSEQMDAFRSTAPLHAAQFPFNLFERAAEDDVLPFCARHGIAALTCGVLCRGLLSGRMRRNTGFPEGDLRHRDPKFQAPRYAQYLEAVDRLDRFARENWGKRVVELAIRWTLDQPGVAVALWGVRRPEQWEPLEGALGWTLDEDAMRTVARIVDATVSDPVGTEFVSQVGGNGSPAESDPA